MKLRDFYTIPNILTTIRLIAILPLVYLILAGPSFRLKAGLLFIAIWLTDALDGYIARRFEMCSDFGKLFDPLVDKIFQLATALALAYTGLVPYWLAFFIFLREVLMIIGSAFMYKRKNKVVYATWFGKLTTFLYVTAFVLIFFVKTPPVNFSFWVFLPAILASIVSTILYTVAGLKSIREEA